MVVRSEDDELARANKRQRRAPSPTASMRSTQRPVPESLAPDEEPRDVVVFYVPYNNQILAVLGCVNDPNLAAVLPSNPAQDYQIKINPSNEKYYVSSMTLGMSRWVAWKIEIYLGCLV